MDDILSVMKDGGTSPADFFACFNRLVELGEWEEFSQYAFDLFFKEYAGEKTCGCFQYNQWLLSRTESGHYRLCVLVAEWLKQTEGGSR
jgi:hypothetical protein